jgi:hypothetical protein
MLGHILQKSQWYRVVLHISLSANNQYSGENNNFCRRLVRRELTHLGLYALCDVGFSLVQCHAFDKIDIRLMRWIVGFSNDSTWYGISGFGERNAGVKKAYSA